MLRPDTLQITPEILRLIAGIDEFKGAWRALGTLAPDRLSALRRVATIESIGSSTRIEGSKLSDRDVDKLLSNLAFQFFETRDEQEVAGYAELMDLVFNSWQDIPFNESHIKQLHQILLCHSEKDTRHWGQYKTNSNSVAAFDENGVQIAIVFDTATPFDTPRLMTELVAWVNQEREKAQLHPLLIIAIFVVVFLEIHPFQDGNGRLSRVLTTLLLIQTGYAYVPLVHWKASSSRTRKPTTWPCGRRKARSAPIHPTGNRGWCFSCTRWPSKSAGWRRRLSAKRSYWPLCQTCQCRSSSSLASTGVSRLAMPSSSQGSAATP
jgi:Fic family protein